jgi:hypothetical protein
MMIRAAFDSMSNFFRKGTVSLTVPRLDPESLPVKTSNRRRQLHLDGNAVMRCPTAGLALFSDHVSAPDLDCTSRPQEARVQDPVRGESLCVSIRILFFTSWQLANATVVQHAPKDSLEQQALQT